MATIEEVVNRYIALRDEAAVIAKRHKEELAPINDKMEKIETWLLAKMNQDGVDSYKTPVGTPYKSVTNSVTLEDSHVFKQFVLVPGAKAIQDYLTNLGITGLKASELDSFLSFLNTSIPWNLVDFRAGKKGIEEYIEHTGLTPPGVKVSSFTKVNIRRS